MSHKYRVYLVLILIIFITALTSVILLLFNMDIEKNEQLGMGLMGGSFFLTLASFSALFLYFFKKILYRGEINGSVVTASFRQGILFSLGIIGTIILMHFQVLILKTFGLFWLVIIFIELMFQSLQDD